MAPLPPPPRSDGDTHRALHVLSERRAHLARKEAARRQQPSTDPLDDSDDEEQEEEEEEQEVYRESHEGGSPHAAALAEPVASDSLEDGEHWRTLAPGLHVCEEPFACEQAAAGCCSSPRQEENDFERRLPEFRAALLQDGYMQSEEPVVGAAALHALREGVGALQVKVRDALPPPPTPPRRLRVFLSEEARRAGFVATPQTNAR